MIFFLRDSFFPFIGRVTRALDQISCVTRDRASERDAWFANLLVRDDEKNTIHAR